jgi:transposase InsO family protein
MVGHRKSQISTHAAGVKRGLTRFEYVHVMIDDRSRLVYAEVLPTLKASCAIDFLRWAVSWFAPRGVQVRAVMSDNGSAYVAHAYRSALTGLGLRATCASAPTDRAPTARQRDSSRRWPTSGPTSASTAAQPKRTAALPLFLERYNFKRPHGSLGHQPPASRLTNVLRDYS